MCWVVCTLQCATFRKVLSCLNWRSAGNSTYQLGTQNEGNCLTFTTRLRITSIMQCNLIKAVLDTTLYFYLTSQFSLCTTPIPQAHQRHYTPGTEEPFSGVSYSECDEADLSCHVRYVNWRFLVEGLHWTTPSHTRRNCYNASIQKICKNFSGTPATCILSPIHPKFSQNWNKNKNVLDTFSDISWIP